MKLLIPYRLDINNGHELRYAIRSMVKYFKPFSGVCVIGDKPYWYTGEHIDCRDNSPFKERNIVNKVLGSPYEDFLYSNDDFFALKPFDETLPNYYSGTLSDAKVHGKYILRRDAVKFIYPDGLFYDIHTPMVINLAKYREANNVDWEHKEYLCKSLYGNFIGGGELLPDCKIRQGKDIPDAPFFSTNERTAKMINLELLYPQKSDYETTIN